MYVALTLLNSMFETKLYYFLKNVFLYGSKQLSSFPDFKKHLDMDVITLS